MALTVAEVMNPELFSVREYDRIDDALATLLALGLSAAPVVDALEHPIGMVSWRDLVKHTSGDTIAGRMTRPATVIPEGEAIESAARQLAEAGLHHAPVVDPGGRLVGFLSMLDAMRGVLGLAAGHPTGFPHYDADTGAVWTDPRPLSEGELEAAPAGPGVLVLIRGGRNQPDQVVWAEAAAKVRSRLLDLSSQPQRAGLLFRAAAVPDETRREDLAALLMNGVRRHAWRERIGD